MGVALLCLQRERRGGKELRLRRGCGKVWEDKVAAWEPREMPPVKEEAPAGATPHATQDLVREASCFHFDQ